MPRTLSAAHPLGWSAALLLASSVVAWGDEQIITYDQVRPVLRKHCASCHNAERPRGDLDLSSLESIRAGSASGPVALPAEPDNSLLFTVVAHLEEPFMPPNSPKIPQREIDLIRRWIEGGMAESVKPAAGRPRPTDRGNSASPNLRQASPSEPELAEVRPLPRPVPITGLAISPIAPLAALSGNRQAVLFSLENFQPLKAFPFPEGDIHTLQFSQDGNLLLIGGGTPGAMGLVIGVDVDSGRRLFQVGDETDIVLAADIRPDREVVALGGPGRTVRLFRTSDGEPTATLHKHTDWIFSLSFSPDGLLLASSDRFGGVRIWDAASGDEFLSLRGHVGPVHAVVWSEDSERLLTAGEDGTLRWWDMHTGNGLAVVAGGPGGGLLGLSRLPDGRLFSGGRAKKLWMWNEAQEQQWQRELSDELVELAVSRDGQWAVAADAAGRVSVVSTATGQELGVLELPVDPALARKPLPIVHAPVARASLPSRGSAPAEPVDGAVLVETREALAAAEAAVVAAEDALARARETAARLRILLGRQEAAARQAARETGETR
jgi:WD40 repeat protein